jgi:tRNA (cmo5U34)-methyltransferase
MPRGRDPVAGTPPPRPDDIASISDFDFGEGTAAVFDDMLDRSIPEYRELQRMVGELAATFAEPDTRIYDLGCSTGITLETLLGAVETPVEFVGLDYSPSMLERACERLSGFTETHALRLQEADLNDGVEIENASVVVLNLTLQFVRPLRRDRLIADINRGMNPNGCLILVEKVLGNDSLFNRTFTVLCAQAQLMLPNLQTLGVIKQARPWAASGAAHRAGKRSGGDSIGRAMTP